jgi:serine protease Do
VKEVGSFRNEVALTPPGSRERLTIVREGQQRNLEVTIGMLRKEKRLGQGSAQSAAELGLTVQTLTFELASSSMPNPARASR